MLLEVWNNDIKLEHISKTFGEGLAKTNVLKDINLEVQPGEFIILNGASGSGKSTLLNILGGLLTPTDGKILYEGHDLYSNYKNSTDLMILVLFSSITPCSLSNC